MKKVKLILSIFMLALLTFGLVSCGGFIAEESVVITDIKITPKDDGTGSNITIITLVNGEYEEEHKFFVANGDKGDTGETGNGIAGITYAPSADKKSTICTITFTDEEIEPKQIEIPNGSSIASVYTSPDDETGGTVVNFVLENGTELAPILVPKGNDGKDGIGIKNHDQTEEDGNKVLILTLTNDEEIKITIPSGKDGNGIMSIASRETETEYILIINYTDFTTEEVSFNKPKDPSKWYKGTVFPNEAKDGDYFFNITQSKIYYKQNDNWEMIVSFKSESEKYYVIFDVNADDAELPSGTNTIYEFGRGEYFASKSEPIPVPVRVGYEFMGWYTTKSTPSLVNGAFTDLTAVFSDITLYAYWKVKQYEITFDTNGGNDIGTITLDYETVLTDIVPTKSGYTFGGWFTSKECVTEDQVFKVPAKDVTLYARWISE